MNENLQVNTKWANIKCYPGSPERKSCLRKADPSRKNSIQPNRFMLRIFGALIFFPVAGWAQTPSAQRNFWDDPFNNPLTPLIVVTAMVLITILLVFIVAIYMIRVLNIMVQQAAKEKAEKQGLVYVPEVSWWEKIWNDLNAAVPVSQEKDIDLGHSYDGIRELDNHLPPWWKGLFYGTVIWAVGYLIVFHIASSMPLSLGEYENELTAADEQARAYKASQPQEVIDENTLLYAKDDVIIAKGKTVFMSNNCGSCHRNDGGGSTIGPNLTDAYWIHGGEMKNIFVTINKGVVEKGMPAWGKVMSPQDVRNVAFYVMSLQGSNPPNPKAPQGELFTPARPDSTKQAMLERP